MSGPTTQPDVFFLPLAVPRDGGFGSLDAGVLSRRIPDFIQLLLNRGQLGPAALLEIQSPPDEGPVRWVTLREPPDPGDAFDMLPEGDLPRALIMGTITPDHDDGLQLELEVHLAEQLGSGVSTSLRTRLSAAAPVARLGKLAEGLARILELPPPRTGGDLLTGNAAAFWAFLRGLDGAALLSGDLAIQQDADGEALMAPFAEALRLDPAFGLALRTVHMTLAAALDGARIGEAACYRVIDRCFRTNPGDGEGCVAVAEHLAVLGEDRRAQAWLEHATHLDPPPPRGLESLGILFANRGETVAARDLWLRGLEVDGHPDFFAHLARLAFAEQEEQDAWDKVVRGLRRVYERATRADEWGDDERGTGVLLRYLVEHLDEARAPEEVVEGLADLSGYLREPEDRIDLGLCLLAARRGDLARVELLGGLEGEVEPGQRDQAVRAILALEIPEFERRFAQAVDRVMGRKDPRTALEEFEVFFERRPDFWPARFFAGVGVDRLGDQDRALDMMAEVLALRPGQPDACHRMAELFAARGNPKRALECVDEALLTREEDARMLASRARYLLRLGRFEDALQSIDQAIEIDPSASDFRRLRREICHRT